MQQFNSFADLLLILHIFCLFPHFLSATSLLLVNNHQTSIRLPSRADSTENAAVYSVRARSTVGSTSNQTVQRSQINNDQNYFNMLDLFANQSLRTDNRELSETDYIGYKSYRNDSASAESVTNILEATDIAEEQAELKNSYWALVLMLFPLTTIFGNSLVVLSVFREKNLRTVTNYFVVSLALADMTVAAAVMPFAVYYEVTKRWLMSKVLCDAWVAVDVMASTASILNLVAIAVDRFVLFSFLCFFFFLFPFRR